MLFFPDQHLGRNTGYRMGIPLEAMPVFDPYEDRGGLTDAQIRARADPPLEGPLLGAQPVHARDGRRASGRRSRA